MNSILAVGSVAFDSIKTPSGEVSRVVGGSAAYFSIAASFFAHVRIVAVVGDDFGEEGDEVTVFGLTVKDSEITGGNASWSVSYYETLADALLQDNVIADPTQYTNTSVGGAVANPQTLYVVVTDTDTGCVDYTTLTIRVLPNPTPTPSEDLPDLVEIAETEEDLDLPEMDLSNE